MKQCVVTTSWDDGHKLDLRLAGLLSKYNLTGTFFISPNNREINAADRLTKEQIVYLDSKFEIGAHTLTHPKLSQINEGEAKMEIVESKNIIEQMVGHKISSFCYPSGDFGEREVRLVKEAGFKIARTTSRFSLDKSSDFFRLPTTIHAYRHWSDAIKIWNESSVLNFFDSYLNWDSLAINMFDKTRAKYGVFHLWGHSWEIDKRRDWQRLEKVFEHISGYKDIKYLKNSELYE